MGQALRGEDLTLFGDGAQTRSFCFVDDLVEGIIRLLHSDEVMPVNLGNPREMTIKQFGEAVLEATGARCGFVHKPLPEDDPKVRKPDISKATRLLDWEPKIVLEEGLARTVDYFKGKVNAAAK